MTDIVEQLRALAKIDGCRVSVAAADEIERLRKEVAVVTARYLEVCSQRDQLLKAFSPPRDTPRPVETGRFGTYPPMSVSCPVCHIQGVNGLVCYNPNCPTRVTSG